MSANRDSTGGVAAWANASSTAPRSRVSRAKCRPSLSFPVDPRRGLSCTVIQVEAKLELGRIRHEPGVPGWIEHDFNMNFLNTGQLRKLAVHISLQHVAHTATGSCHGHSDMNTLPALFQGRNHARVNQTQIHDIDRNLWVVHGLQPIPDHLIAEIPFVDRR